MVYQENFFSTLLKMRNSEFRSIRWRGLLQRRSIFDRECLNKTSGKLSADYVWGEGRPSIKASEIFISCLYNRVL